MQNALELVERIDVALPQTQCRRCGYDGCRPYAEAVAHGEAIDRCPPGGGPLIRTLAELTGGPESVGPGVTTPPEALRLACIVEADCIGCTLCIQACPVDAIIGAAKQMHAVISAWCTGCELCVPVCPVDCIDMPLAPRTWSTEDARAAKSRYVARNRRLAERAVNAKPHHIEAAAVIADIVDLDALERSAFVTAARGRARLRRSTQGGKTGPG